MGAPRLKPHNPDELARLLEWVSGKSSILEIGSRYGYTIVDIAGQMKPGSKIVCVDLPDQEGWNDPIAVDHLKANIESLRTQGFDAHLMIGDSHDPQTVEWVKTFAPFDVVFIDGDHTYEGVSQDWQNYGDMGDIVIFHDIRKPEPPEWMGLGVWKLWRDIRAFSQVKKRCPIEEFLAPGSKMGIGRIDRDRAV